MRRRKCLHDGRCVLHGGTLCGAPTVERNDDNPCTEDQCDTGSGCTFEELGDERPATTGMPAPWSMCVEGVCAGTAKPCEEDDTPCTVQTGCDAESGECLTQNLPDGTMR